MIHLFDCVRICIMVCLAIPAGITGADAQFLCVGSGGHLCIKPADTLSRGKHHGCADGHVHHAHGISVRESSENDDRDNGCFDVALPGGPARTGKNGNTVSCRIPIPPAGIVRGCCRPALTPRRLPAHFPSRPPPAAATALRSVVLIL